MTEPIASFDRGPYLQAALFCERILDEKDEVKSIIRIIDRMRVQASGTEAPERMPPFQRDLTAFLSFKSGDARGPVPIKVTLTRPSGLTDGKSIWHGTVHFEGGTRGQNLTLHLRISFQEAGPYWFNVYVDDRLATRMPFEVIYTTVSMAASPPPPPAP